MYDRTKKEKFGKSVADWNRTSFFDAAHCSNQSDDGFQPKPVTGFYLKMWSQCDVIVSKVFLFFKVPRSQEEL